MIVPAVAREAVDGPASLMGWIWRWKFTLGVPVAVCAGLALGANADAPRLYTSEAVLVLDLRSQQVLPSEALIAPLPQENPVVTSELDTIRSRSMAKNAAQLLKARDVEIPAWPTTPGPIPRYLKFVVSNITSAFSWPRAAAGESVARVQERAQALPNDLEAQRATIDSLLEGLSVVNDGHSYTIFITYRSEDPHYSAEAANAFAQAYLDHQVSIHESATQRATDSLGPRVASLGNQLREAEQRLQEYRRETGLMAEKGVTMEEQRISAVNAEIVTSQGQIAQAQARFDASREGAESGDPAADLDSDVMQILRAERARLERERANFEERGAKMSPDLGGILASLDAVDRQISDEGERVLALLAREVEVAKRKEELLRTELDHSQKALDHAEKSAVEAAELEREVATTSSIYATYLTRYKEAIEQEGIAIPEARIVSRAEAGFANSTSRVAKWLLAGVGLGGIVGLGGAGLRSWREQRIASPETIMECTRLPILGYVPRLGAKSLHRAETLPITKESVWTGAVARLLSNTALLLSEGPAVVAVTSTARLDGKTTVALAFARVAAASGMRTLLVDGNLHAPGVALRLGLAPAPGIQDVLDLSVPLEAAVSKAVAHGFDVLGARPEDSPELALSGGDVAALLRSARASYDMIVVDCPAIDALANAAHLAAHADLTFLVIRSKRSLVADVTWAVDQLAAVAPQGRAGVVFNMTGGGPVRITAGGDARAPERDAGRGAR